MSAHESSNALELRIAELESDNDRLASLYVASHQLHGTLERAHVLTAIQEIVVNLIGSENFGVFELGAESLSLVCSVGLEERDAAVVRAGVQRIRSSIESGELLLRPATAGDWVACVPLKVDGHVTGVIAICRLLSHKSELERLDFDLFELLATQAASALHCTSRIERAANQVSA
jgi:hypothetical protein